MTATTTKRRVSRRGLMILGALVATPTLDALAVEPYWIEQSHVAIRAPVKRSLRVMHLSDLHGAGLGAREAKVLSIMEREQPDVIVLTGDTSDRGSFDGYRPFLEKLRAPLGVFAVQGNWEYWQPAADERATLEAANIRLLIDEAVLLRDDVWLVGFDDSTGGSPAPDRALHAIPQPNLGAVLGLMHTPTLFDRLEGKVDVVLAGHTHGGQVRLPMIGPLWTPPGSGRYVSGLYDGPNGSYLFVSRGVGTSILPLRFFCRPEVAIVDIAPMTP